MIREQGCVVVAMPSFKFEGLKPGQKDQPPILKPDGKTYHDLNDPELPVIKSSEHVFRYKYWEIPRTPMYLLKYLQEHWEYFNHSRFGGKLKPCKVALLRDVHAAKMHNRGYWKHSTRQLKISPNLFNAPHEGWVNSTLIHEMAHQYVTDFHGPEADRAEYKILKGHGPLWEAAMIMAKLPPNRLDYTSNDVYRDEDEKFEKDVRDEGWKKGLHKNYAPFTGQNATILDKELQIDHCVIVGKSTRQRDKWVVLTKPSILSMRIITKDQIFHNSGDGATLGDKSILTTNKEWLAVVEKIISQGLAERVDGKGIFGEKT